MFKEVYGFLVTQRIVQFQKQKFYIYVVKGAYFEELVGLVEVFDLSLRVVFERCSYIVFRYQYDGYEQEVEVVVGVYFVLERIYRYGYCNFEILK